MAVGGTVEGSAGTVRRGFVPDFYLRGRRNVRGKKGKGVGVRPSGKELTMVVSLIFSFSGVGGSLGWINFN